MMKKTTTNNNPALNASFRDPSGFLFRRDGVLYRQVNQVYAEEYTRLMDSGLYAKLVKAGLLIAHTELDLRRSGRFRTADKELAFKVLRPEPVPFISYPYEWSFGQLKDAALATLSIQKRALKLGMSLKDASAYNIQFYNGKPTLIDTLSFEILQGGGTVGSLSPVLPAFPGAVGTDGLSGCTFEPVVASLYRW